jgi:hypothetical protein
MEMQSEHKYYIILDVKTTRLYNVQEIIDFAAAVVDKRSFRVLRKYYTYVRPLVLNEIARKTKVNYHVELNDCINGSTMCEALEQCFEKFAEFIDCSLIVTMGNYQLGRALPGALLLSEAMSLENREIGPFDQLKQWCNLIEIFQDNTGSLIEQKYGPAINQMLTYYNLRHIRINRVTDQIDKMITIMNRLAEQSAYFYVTSRLTDNSS